MLEEYWTDSVFPCYSFMEQLMALGVKPRDQDSATKIVVVLKSELAKEKAAWEKVQAKAGTLA
jgi:hypothetical protein